MYGMAEMATRLQVRLMAGQGYDIIVLNYTFPYRAWARSGFFAGIGTLMDVCTILLERERCSCEKERSRQIELAVDRYAVLVEKPIALVWPSIPEGLYQDQIDMFLRGLANPNEAATNIHNRVALWLIE